MQLAFAVDPINVSELGPFDASKPMLYQSIGPVRDARGRYGSLDALLGVVRVIAANKAMEPESQDYTFSVSGISFGGELKEDDAYSVRDKVVEDLKKIVAAKEARQKAEVFLEDAQANGWDETADKFDELYAKDKAESDSDIKQFQLITRNGMTRIPDNVLDNLSVRNQGNPGAKAYSIAMMVEAKRVNQFYSLIPADSNSITAPTIIDFAPGMHSYCIKSLSVKKVYAEDFRNQKAQLAFMEDRNYSQMLALVHYNPKNILQRNNFQLVERKKKAADKQIAEDVNDSTDE